MVIENCTTEEINNLREIRKTLNILQTVGPNVMANGENVLTRFKYLVQKFVDMGLTTDDVSELVDALGKAGYPAKVN